MSPVKQYSYVWKFIGDREEAYREFNLPINSISLKVINVLIIIGMISFIIIDIFRAVDYQFVLTSRLLLTSVSVGVMLFSYRRKLTPAQVDRLLVLSLTSLAIFAIVTTSYGNMPFFFLPNISITILVFVATISGLRWRYSLLFNFLYLMLYLIYSQNIDRDPFFLSQTPNLISMFVYSSIAGLLIEIRRRKNFLQYEDLLRQKKRIEQLDNQKNKIISLLSHDVASPLNSLSGLLQLQLNDQIAKDEVKPFLKKVDQQLNDVSTFLYGLVRWSKSQLKGFVLTKEKIELVNLAHEIVDLFRPLANEKQLQLEVSAPKQFMVLIDEEMIRMTFRNLISNAIKFALNKTTVKIDFTEAPEHWVTLRVSNVGPAIPDEVKNKLFGFQMTSSVGTAGEKGSGLGLVMASQFIQLNGGKIYLEKSDPMGETVFCISLPLLKVATVKTEEEVAIEKK